MPVYFAHGFRWPREGFTGIRVHVILHDLEDCSAEYIQNQNSQSELLSSFRKTYPEIMKELEGPNGKGLTFLEEYDPEDETGENVVSHPWAFVCDFVRAVPTNPAQTGAATAESDTEATAPASPKSPEAMDKGPATDAPSKQAPTTKEAAALSLNVSELIAAGPGSSPKAREALADLRDKIAAGEKIDWWVIYNGDPERRYEQTDLSEDGDVIEEESELASEDYAIGPPFPKDVTITKVNLRSDAPASPTQARGMEMAQPDAPSSKEGRKRSTGMRAFLLPDKPKFLTSVPALKSPAKSESGLKKKLFGKR